MYIIRCVNYANTKFAVVLITVTIPLAERSEATRLLRVRVRIPPGTSMSVSCECCVLSGSSHCTGPITRLEEFTEYGVSNFNLGASTKKRARST
jgi:hypothetical protein